VISNGSHGGHKHSTAIKSRSLCIAEPRASSLPDQQVPARLSPCANVVSSSIADPESSDQDGTILVTVVAMTRGYTVTFGTSSHALIKNPSVHVAPSDSVVISAVPPNPIGDDDQLEEVTLRNSGTAAVSLVGWEAATLQRSDVEPDWQLRARCHAYLQPRRTGNEPQQTLAMRSCSGGY
jgi:hypothetical protein